jgi:hypothetical protein
MPVVKMMEAATPAAGEFLEVCAVFVAVVGLWFGLGFHGFGGGIGGSIASAAPRIELAETPTSRCSNPININ